MINTDHKDSIVSVTVFGEFSLADFKEFEELVLYKLKFEGPVSLFFDLRQMADFTLDVAWAEVQFSPTASNASRCLPAVSGSPGLRGYPSPLSVPICVFSRKSRKPAPGWKKSSKPVNQLA